MVSWRASPRADEDDARRLSPPPRPGLSSVSLPRSARRQARVDSRHPDVLPTQSCLCGRECPAAASLFARSSSSLVHSPLPSFGSLSSSHRTPDADDRLSSGVTRRSRDRATARATALRRVVRTGRATRAPRSSTSATRTRASATRRARAPTAATRPRAA